MPDNVYNAGPDVIGDLSDPATKLIAITPNDNTDLTQYHIRSLWIGGAGNIAVLAVGDKNAVTLSAVPAGTLMPILVKKVMATSTTATLIVGLA